MDSTIHLLNNWRLIEGYVLFGLICFLIGCLSTLEALKSSYELVKTCPCVPNRIRTWECWFLRRGENWSTRRKTSRNKRENQQRTQPTYDVDARIQTWATLVALGCSHHCAFASLVPQLTIAYVRYINSNAFWFGFLCGQFSFGNYQTNIVNILQFFFGKPLSHIRILIYRTLAFQ